MKGVEGTPEEQERLAVGNNNGSLDCKLPPAQETVPQSVFHSTNLFMVVFLSGWVLQGMFLTYFVSVTTTIEKLFRIESKTTGMLLAATEIGQICTSLILTYLAGRGHRPRWIASMMIVLAVGVIGCVLPHILYGTRLLDVHLNVHQAGAAPMCQTHQNTSTCNQQQVDNTQTRSDIAAVVMPWLFICLLVVGVGQTGITTLGIPYIDDNVGSKQSPLYMVNGITLKDIGQLSQDHLREICPKIGDRIKLSNKIDEYLESKATTASIETLDQDSTKTTITTVASEESGDLTDISLSTLYQSFPDFDLKTLLETSPCGKSILNYYMHNGKLDNKRKGRLTDIIIRHLFTFVINKRLTYDDYNVLTGKIISLFPKEAAGIYFTRPVKKENSGIGKFIAARGKLVDKVRNFLFQNKEKKRSAESQKPSKKHKINDILLSFHEDDIEWLNNNNEPWSEVREKWNKTVQIRHELEYTDVHDFVTKWKVLQLPGAPELIDDDFAFMYPDKVKRFKDCWKLFIENVIELKKEEINSEEHKKNLLMSLNSQDIDAITIGTRVLGPALGFLLGALCAKIYVYPTSDPGYESTDPRWVGAWWLGMVFITAFVMLLSSLMFFFPRQIKPEPAPLPVAKQIEKKSSFFKDFFVTMKRQVTNDILMWRTASSVFHLMPISGVYAFLPKYLEQQFKLPTHHANLVSGLGGIMVMGLGILSSGVVIMKVRLTARQIAAWTAITAAAYSVGMVLLMFVSCPEENFRSLGAGAGVNSSLPCSEHCVCGDVAYSPVCGQDSFTYLSPCQAGCQGSQQLDNSTWLYYDCTCVERDLQVDKVDDAMRRYTTLVGASAPNRSEWGALLAAGGGASGGASGRAVEGAGVAVSGECGGPCQRIYVFVALFALMMFVHATGETGAMLLTIRCTAKLDKAIAMGVIQFSIGVFGNVPCPIVFGAAVDAACRLRDTACGALGACNTYDNDKFRYFFLGLSAGIMFLAFLTDLLVFSKAHRIVMNPGEGGGEVAPPRPPLSSERHNDTQF